jgi:hypothetical protein
MQVTQSPEQEISFVSTASRVALLAFLALLSKQAARADSPGPAPTSSPLKTIYRTVVTPLCGRIHDYIRPAVGIVLQNDGMIAKSEPLFKDYARAAFAANGDSINSQSAGTSMALQRMSYLVSPLAQNLIAAQALLDNPGLMQPSGNTADDEKLKEIKNQLLETVAFQSASLDLINGFVATQQMGELQHAGEEYISAIQGTDVTSTTVGQPTANPLLADPNAPGLPPNPYTLNLAAVPGLAVGYNPLTRILDGMHWLQSETAKRESTAALSINGVLTACGISPQK